MSDAPDGAPAPPTAPAGDWKPPGDDGNRAGIIPVWRHIDKMSGWLAKAREAAIAAPPDLTKAAEWLLDNDYRVHRTIRQVRHDLPSSFYERLPAETSGEDRLPRVFIIAHGLLRACRLQLSLGAAVGYVRGAQGETPLSIAELWAFPTMLRLACLEILAVGFSRLFPAVKTPFRPSAYASAADHFDDIERVARALANLGLIASVPWDEFFDQTSRVEEILIGDSAGVYAKMDFATRDRYRRAVEELAQASTHGECDVAARAVARTSAGQCAVSAARHVGYWLIGEGRPQFEAALGCRPSRAEWLKRKLADRARLLYAGALLLVGSGGLVLPAVYMAAVGAAPLAWIVYLIVALVPTSILAVTLVHWSITQLIKPELLPKVDFDKRIAGDCKTLVVVPVLIGSPDEGSIMLERLEAHRLANPDSSLQFALVSDLPDAPAERQPEDDAIEAVLVAGITALNARYGSGSKGPFHLLHRGRQFSPAENCWMGWERKRGKLEQMNRFLLGEEGSGFALHAGERENLSTIRFVVTVDADTRLPAGSVNRLVGTLAHPLNQARVDPATGRIVSGYSIIQPRVEISPESGNRSIFARLYTGDTAIDIYSRAVSDIYQDLFGEGIFVGKGIYEVAHFHRSVDGRVPENAVLSHDLFEGILGRAALATDIVLYESFPDTYLEFVRRSHRWIRGDWQLLPWLFAKVPGSGGTRLANPMSALGRWKMLDNLRRSVIAPALILFALAGWAILPGSPWVWTVLTVLAPGAHLFTDVISGLARGPRRGSIRGQFAQLGDQSGRWLLAIAFLPKEAVVAVHAIATALWRMIVTRRGLLEWTSAAHVAARSVQQRSRAAMWRAMWVGPAFAMLIAAALILLRPAALPAAATLLVLWAVSPEIGVWLGRSRMPEKLPLKEEERRFLRKLARRTWFYFESFAGPEDHWLPPDNYQEAPFEEIAHRTSPTNIGMMLVSGFTAWDLGHIGSPELAARLGNAFKSFERLETHRGHFLNWYDTRTLTPLEPRYVSTVDSGNLAACLIVAASGCREAAQSRLFSGRRWEGFYDILGIIDEAGELLAAPERTELQSLVDAIRTAVIASRQDPLSWRKTLSALAEGGVPRLETTTARLLSADGRTAAADSGLSTWVERLAANVHAMLRDLDHLTPWLAVLDLAPRDLPFVTQSAFALFSSQLSVAELKTIGPRLRELLEPCLALDHPDAAWAAELKRAFETGLRNQCELAELFQDLARRASDFAYAMDFTPLYDRERRLFHIGYNVSSDRLDPHYYDLLATEARIGSYFAIAKGDVPAEHWFFLGRPLTREAGGVCLLSWNGSMFEYLMAPIFLRSGPETLVGESERVAVDIQRGYGSRLAVPWGISESAFALRDPEHRYRYQAFGSPGLGLKRDLGKDLVVAPYASALALTTQPAAAVDNLKNLWRLGAGGLFGLFEAIDFTTGRAEAGRMFTPVRAYMAHHQGMILAAIGNALGEDILVRRFRDDPRMRTVDLLLSERIPREVPSEIERVHEQPAAPQAVPSYPTPHAWVPTSSSAFPQAHALGNGRLSSLISEAGGGGLHWRQRALTRFVPDATRDHQGLWIYLSDEESGALWSATRQPTGAKPDEYRVVFHPHAAEFHRRDHGIALRTEIGVAEGDDVEMRRVTIVNESPRRRRLCITSYGEVVLAPPLDDERHPAFSKLFVKSEYLPGMEGLLFTRRPRNVHEAPPVLVHRLIGTGPGVSLRSFETDRRAFLGRAGDPRSPVGLRDGLSKSEGWTLDPVMALQVEIELAAHESRELCFITVAAASRETALETAQRYATMASVEWAFDDASTAVAAEAQRLRVGPDQFPPLQKLVSPLVYPHPALRGREEVLQANQLGQPELWGMGLSGDRPILLLRLEGENSPLLADLIKGHRLWSKRGIEVDLVVLKMAASSYLEPTRDEVVDLLDAVGAREFLGRKGGVHLLSSDQIGPQLMALLESVARVVLEDSEGGLAQQLEAIQSAQREIPVFQAIETPDDGPQEPFERMSSLSFDNGLGGFGADGREYAIHLPPGAHTPAPWCNLLANETFGTLVTETGGGFTWAVNSGENRITPWSNDPVSDTPGEMLYLRDEESGAVWTPAPFAAHAACEVRHGLGYSRWRQRSHHLDQEMLVFVPAEDPVKIIRLRVKNLLQRPRRVTATYFAEWLLGSMRSIATPAVVVDYDAGQRIMGARSSWNPDFGTRVAFLTASSEPHGLTLDRHEFIGQEGSLRSPAALHRWGLSGSVSPRTDPCAAWQLHLDLGPGEEQEVLFVLGQGADRAQAAALARKWRSLDQAELGFQALGDHWRRTLDAVEIATPDPAFDAIVNHWLLYQTISSRVRARAGYYQAGGAVGFRDQLQDMLAVLHTHPDRVREHILLCAAHQFEEGDVMHWWHPPSDRGVRTRCSDDLLWLPYVVARYVEATGDLAILSEDAPFLRAPPLGSDEEDRYALFESAPGASLFDHCVRAIEHGVTRGSHGLPLMGSGDWNDGMDRVGREGRGESVWLAWFSTVMLEDFAPLADRFGRKELADAWRRRAAEIRSAAETNGWDGQWYRRAYDDAGEPWGSASNSECRIDSISQSWAAFAGADSERVKIALAAAKRELVLEEARLVRLLTPPFDESERDPGYIKAYPPGVRENGGQYTHAAAWLGFAFAQVGDGDEAYRIFDLLNPLKHAATPEQAEHYRTEPYVVSADIADGGDRTGRGGWSWYTGSSAWMWRLAVEAIVGVTLVDGGVVLSPCLPRQWRGCKVILRRPHGTLDIRIEDPEALGAGPITLIVNGELWTGNRLPFPDDGSTSQVVATIGRSAADSSEAGL